MHYDTTYSVNFSEEPLICVFVSAFGNLLHSQSKQKPQNNVPWNRNCLPPKLQLGFHPSTALPTNDSLIYLRIFCSVTFGEGSPLRLVTLTLDLTLVEFFNYTTFNCAGAALKRDYRGKNKGAFVAVKVVLTTASNSYFNWIGFHLELCTPST